MPRIVKNTLLNYIPQNFEVENFVNPVRVFDFNNKPIQKGEIVYLCEREIRVKDNFALKFALQKSKELNLPLKIIHPKINYEHLPKEKFIIRQLIQVSRVQEYLMDFQLYPIYLILYNTHPIYQIPCTKSIVLNYQKFYRF